MKPQTCAKILFLLVAISSVSYAAPFSLFSKKNAKKAESNKIASEQLSIYAEITGIEGEMLDNVSARLRANLRPVHETTQKSDIQVFYQKAPQQIEEALKPFGYFNPKITSKLLRHGKKWNAYFHVEPGKAIKIDNFQIIISGQGHYDEKFQELKIKLLEEMPSTLSAKQYEDAKQDLFDLASQRGYFQARIKESRMLINLKQHKASLYIHFDTGPRYHFGEISFAPSPLSDDFLHRFVQIQPGEPYSEKKIETLKRALSNSNYFKRVVIKPEKNDSLNVPLYIKTKTKKARQYVVGGGWGNDTGIKGFLAVHFRRLNPQGHQARMEVFGSQYQNNAKAIYMIPGKNPATDQYRIIGSLEKLTNLNPGFGSNKKGEVNYSTIYKGWHPLVSLMLLREKYTLNIDPLRIPRTDTMLVPSFYIARAESDKPLQATKGYKIGLKIRGASKSLLADNSFFQARFNARTLYSLTDDQRIALRASIAYTKINNILNLPLSLQYYAGGQHSVRGYGYLSIGPGKYFSVGSVEFQQRLKGNLFLAAFYDAGSVNNKGFFKDVKRSPGIGLIYFTPIGDIQIDVAKALDRQVNPFRKEKSFRIQFSVGSDLFTLGTPE